MILDICSLIRINKATSFGLEMLLKLCGNFKVDYD